MPAAYVYAPFNGELLGQEKYCDNTNHVHVRLSEGWDDPLDIEASGNTIVRFYASTAYVKSIRTQRVGWICQDTSLFPYTYGVLVSLYKDTAGTNYIGGVMYGHLQTSGRIVDGLYTSFYTIQIGKIIGSTCVPCSCYKSPHIHMERKNGFRRDFSCCTCMDYMVYSGGDWIFGFTV